MYLVYFIERKNVFSDVRNYGRQLSIHILRVDKK